MKLRAELDPALVEELECLQSRVKHALDPYDNPDRSNLGASALYILEDLLKLLTAPTEKEEDEVPKSVHPVGRPSLRRAAR